MIDIVEAFRSANEQDDLLTDTSLGKETTLRTLGK